jgi:sulfhydrogenase subunit delta
VTRPITLPAPAADRPTLAVWKFASCDGCQLSLLDCERELLAVADRLTIASFPEASTAVVEGPYDVSLVEGSVSTPDDVARIGRIRAESRVLITIGACATAGGIQALRNGASVENFMAIVYAHPEFISTLDDSTAIADHVRVDFELRGCPIDRAQLLEVITAFVNHRPPSIATTTVCTECKARAIPCVMVAEGTPCLGPVTHAGCRALCPSYSRGCYGCFGPSESANTAALDAQFAELGLGRRDRERMWRGFTAWAPPFRAAGDRVADGGPLRPGSEEGSP